METKTTTSTSEEFLHSFDTTSLCAVRLCELAPEQVSRPPPFQFSEELELTRLLIRCSVMRIDAFAHSRAHDTQKFSESPRIKFDSRTALVLSVFLPSATLLHARMIYMSSMIRQQLTSCRTGSPAAKNATTTKLNNLHCIR